MTEFSLDENDHDDGDPRRANLIEWNLEDAPRITNFQPIDLWRRIMGDDGICNRFTVCRIPHGQSPPLPPSAASHGLTPDESLIFSLCVSKQRKGKTPFVHPPIMQLPLSFFVNFCLEGNWLQFSCPQINQKSYALSIFHCQFHSFKKINNFLLTFSLIPSLVGKKISSLSLGLELQSDSTVWWVMMSHWYSCQLPAVVNFCHFIGHPTHEDGGFGWRILIFNQTSLHLTEFEEFINNSRNPRELPTWDRVFTLLNMQPSADQSCFPFFQVSSTGDG